MSAPPWTDAETETLQRLHSEGASLNRIAQAMGRGTATIHRKAKALGLSFDRTKLAAAIEAKQTDNRARRAVIVARMYARVEHLQGRLEADRFVTLVKGQYGAEEREVLDFVPTADERNLGDTIGRYALAAVKLEQVDADHGEASVRGMLTQLGEALGVGHEQTSA